MKFFAAILLIGFAPFVWAADEAAAMQVRAATKDAVANLLEEVSRVPLTRNLSVGEFVRRTNSADELAMVLQRSQQIGGPRWIDENTCQIELQISGPLVAQALKRAAASNPRRSPLAINDLDRIVNAWNQREFSATGSATSRLPVVKPRRPAKVIGGANRDPWWDLADAVRDQAVAAAKVDAARRGLSGLTSVPLTAKSTVGDLLAIKEVNDAIVRWLSTQPAASLELNDDLQAEVELGTTPAEVYARLRLLALQQREVAIPADEQEWSKVKIAFDRQMPALIGRAVANPGEQRPGEQRPVGVAPKPLGLPQRPPQWVARRLEASGNGAPAKAKLLAARAAEVDAHVKLRKMIDDLQLNPKVTLAQAAKDDARIDKAIVRAIGRCKIGKADYHENGSADVAVYLDLDALWQELRDAE